MIKKRFLKFFLSSQGTAVLEFAMIAPFLIFLTFLAYEGANLILVNGRVHDTALILARALSEKSITFNLGRCGNVCQVISQIPQYSLGRYNKEISVTVYGVRPFVDNAWVQWVWKAGWTGISGKSTVSQYGTNVGGYVAVPAGVLPASVSKSLTYPQSAIVVKVTYVYKPVFKLFFKQETFTAMATTLTQSGQVTLPGSCSA